MILVQPSDFVGQYTLARTNKSDVELQSFIDREEKPTIYKIFGMTLGDLLIAYIGTNMAPPVARFDNLLNVFYLQSTLQSYYIRQSDNSEPAFYSSTGLKDVLINRIFYCYVTETSMSHSQAGVASPSIDTASRASAANTFRFAEQKWNNSGYDTWLALWWRCLFYENAIYPEYAGTKPEVEYGSLF